MNKFKKFVTFSLASCLCLSTLSVSILGADVPEYEVEESVNNGVVVQSIGDGDSYTKEEKEAILNHFSPDEPAVYSYDYIDEKDDAQGSNRNSHCVTYVETEWDVDRAVVLTSNGYTEATWFGDGNWDKCYIHQSSTVNSVDASISISWPPSLDVSSDEETATWDSDPFYDEWEVKVDRGEMVAESYIWISSFVAEDSADMYIGSNVYRPSTYIKISKP